MAVLTLARRAPGRIGADPRAVAENYGGAPVDGGSTLPAVVDARTALRSILCAIDGGAASASSAVHTGGRPVLVARPA
jgi:hypothetical protein